MSRSWARTSGATAADWTGWILGLGDREPERARLGESLDDGRCERAAADLDEQPVEVEVLPVERLGELVAERQAALDGEAVLVALAGERDGAGVDRRVQAARRSGRPGSPGRRSQTVTWAPSSLRRPTTAGCASGGMKTSRSRPAAAATTAAASAAFPQLAMARRDAGRRPAGDGVGDLELEQRAHQVAGLVRAADIAGLVLDEDAAVVREAERLPSSTWRGNGVTRNPTPSVAATAASRRSTSAT